MPENNNQTGAGERDASADEADVLRQRAEDSLNEACLRLKQQWREHPATVAAAALGVGLILGLLIGGRR